MAGDDVGRRLRKRVLEVVQQMAGTGQTGFGVQLGLFGGAILQLGTKPHHDAYLDDLIHGRLIGCFAMTESGAAPTCRSWARPRPTTSRRASS
ncbi:hypothetical protein BH10ACT10_BH10ACT10_29730 [soil metagenome]